jgi:hypothetical protein
MPPPLAAGGPAVGLAIPEGPVRHGPKSKYVDVRPGRAGRLLPKERLCCTGWLENWQPTWITGAEIGGVDKLLHEMTAAI